MTRAGFVALAGRPNVGKSTFVNAVVGEKVAIVSDRPQTTRRAIRGVHASRDCQMVLVDLPGVQRPRDALTIVQICGVEVRSLCAGVPFGGGRVISCLAANASSLSPGCYGALSAAAGR